MKHTTKILVAATAIAFSGSAFSGSYTDRQKEDIIHGQGISSSNPAQPHSGMSSRPDGFSEDLFHNIEKAQPSAPPVPYERAENDRDNSQDLLYS